MNWVRSIGRLRAGVTLEAAQDDIDGLSVYLEENFADWSRGGVRLSAEARFHPSSAGIGLSTGTEPPSLNDSSLRALIRLLMAGSVAVLLVGCVNIAILMLARGSARSGDAAVRMAVGAAKSRIIRGALMESMVLALLGGALGLGLAHLTSGLVGGILPGTFSVSFEPDGTVLAFACALSVGTAFWFGLVPAIRTGRVDLSRTLKGDQGVSDRSRIRGGLVVTQVAVAVSLAVAAALTARSFATASAVPLGYEVEDRILLSMNLSEAGYSEERAQVFISEALERLRVVPGVRSASTMASVPFESPELLTTGRAPPTTTGDRSASTQTFSPFGAPVNWTTGAPAGPVEIGSPVESFPPRLSGEHLLAQISNSVSPEFFRTMGIEVIAGRGIDETDIPGAPPAVVVSAGMARTFWPDQDPVGQGMLTPDGSVQLKVVGVVEDTRFGSVSSRPERRAYSAIAQNYRPRVTFVVHGDVGASRLTGMLLSLDPGIAFSLVQTMQRVVGKGVDRFRTAALLVGVFGVLALVLAMVGLYGVLSYAVVRARRDIGIRLALGASRRGAGRAVVGRALRLVALGLFVGGLLSFLGAPVLASFLFGVGPRDPAVWTAAGVLVIVVAVASSLAPAMRAAKVDPIEVLRAE